MPIQRHRLLPPAFAAALLVAVLAAPAALADSKPIVLTNEEVAFRLQGSHDYRIRIEAESNEVDLLARSGDGREAEYRAIGRVTSQRLKANFGRLGFVSVRFDGGKPRHRIRRDHCGIQKEAVRKGVFRGTIRFRGEEGFTSVSARTARGSVVRTVQTLCTQATGGRDSRAGASAQASAAFLGTVLAAGKEEKGRRTAFLYNGFAELTHGKPVEESAFLLVGVFERRGRLRIERRGDFGNFETGRNPVTVPPREDGPVRALFTPPSPFAGAGEYSKRGPYVDAKWTGDLRVSLPGEADVSLAGPGFRSVFCRGRKTEGCYEEASALYAGTLVGI